MTPTGENRRTQRKTFPGATFCATNLTWTGWASVVRERRLAARARAWPPRRADFVFSSYFAVNTTFPLQRPAGFYWLGK
jgi:hypothetical protein